MIRLGHRIASIGALASLLCGCTAITPPPLVIRSDDAPRAVLKVNSGVQNVANRFLADYSASYQHPDDGAPAQRMTRSGMTLIEIRCDLFFEKIGKGSQGLDFVHREIETISGALIAALGIANVSKDVVTGAGLGANLATRSLSNFGDVYFFSPDVAAVQKLVQTAEASVRALAFSPGKEPKSYDDAIGYLSQYQNICTAHQIRALVSASVSAGKVQASFIGAEDSPAQAAINAYLPVLAKNINLPLVPIDQLVLLKWAIQNPDDPSKLIICATLQEDFRNGFCDAAGKPTYKLPTSPPWTAIVEGITYIDRIEPDYLNSRLATTKKNLARQAGVLAQQQKDKADIQQQLDAELAKKQKNNPAADSLKVTLTQIEDDQRATASNAQAIAKQASTTSPSGPAKIEIKVAGQN